MHETSALYKQLLSEPHVVETRVAIGETGRLIDEWNNTITFGGLGILVGRSGADAGYTESMLKSVTTLSQVFSRNKPEVGCCVSSELDLVMIKPAGDIPRMAQVVPYVRLSNGIVHSEWIQKGVYYVDTRANNADDSTIRVLKLHCYDAMLKAEQDYIGDRLQWPSTDLQVVQDIAELMEVSIEPETAQLLNRAYEVQLPVGYTRREVLGYIAAMYAGCFIMSDAGELRLLRLNGIPKETRYLIDQNGFTLTFGGIRIRV